MEGLKEWTNTGRPAPWFLSYPVLEPHVPGVQSLKLSREEEPSSIQEDCEEPGRDEMVSSSWEDGKGL